MKQNYAISLALLAASAFAGNASTYNLKFHCENHSDLVAISVQTSTQDSSGNWTVAEGTSYTFGEDKDVVVPYDSDQNPTIHALIIDPDGDSEYYIDDITVEGSGSAWKANGNKDWGIYAYSSGVDVNYDIVVTSDAEKYTDTLYLKVDDPSAANLSFATSYRSIDSSKLVAGEFTPILFDPESDGQLLIYNKKDYTKTFYKVIINDVDKTNDYYYGIAVAANDKVEILYTYPDVKCNITFKYATEESKGCVKKVSVDGAVPEDLTEDGFTIQMGSTAIITVDDEWYKLENMTINGVAPSYVYSPYTINKILEDTEIEFTASRYDTFDITVNVDTPKNVKVYRGGSSYNGTLLQLEAGENTITLSSNKTTLSIAPRSGATIESIKDADENELYPTSSWDTAATFYSVKEGDVYTVTTSAMERNNVFVLYVDDPTIPQYGYAFERGSDRSYLNEDADQGKVPAGYSTFYFGDSVSDEETYTIGENVFTFACYDNYSTNPDKPRNLYVNDEKVEPEYEGSASWEVTLSDKDVVKIYLASNPELAAVSFDVPEDVEVSVVKDLITEASTEGFNALPGTQVDLSFNGLEGYDVYLNDEKVEVSEDAYSFNVAGDTVVKVALASENGVSSVSADSSINNIYNLQGIKVGTNRNQLPAGIYIINGRKVAVK